METPIARLRGTINFDKIVYENGKFDQIEVESIIFVYRSEVNEAVEDQSSRAYRAIRNGIVTGRYRPGQRLVESTIASLEGVSRTPVRAALRWLEREGVVDIEKRRGARVRRLSAEQVSDLYELRARIEGHACELAASRASKEDAAELCALADVFDTSLAELPEDRDFACCECGASSEDRQDRRQPVSCISPRRDARESARFACISKFQSARTRTLWSLSPTHRERNS